MKERVYKIGNSTITIKFGDITTSQADVIVSSDDTGITMGGGVSRCIRKTGGDIVQKDAQKKLPAFLGDVVVSTAGNLPCQYIFHCLTIDYHDRGITFYQNKLYGKTTMIEYIVRHNVEECCRLMQALNINSIAFPLIGTGTAQLDMETTAEVMSKALADYLSKTSRPYQIELYLFDESLMENKEEKIYYKYRHVFECFYAEEKLYTKDEDILEESDSQEGSETPVPLKVYPVFISFSSKDWGIVQERVVKVLNKENIPCFAYEKENYKGTNYKEVITQAIENAKVVIFVSTKNSNASTEVNKEIDLSGVYKKHIIPVKFDNAQYSKTIAYDLSSITYIDIRKADAIQQLVERVKFFMTTKE